MWKWDDETGWTYDGYTDIYIYQKRIFEYPVSMHLEKLNMSITEAAIATRQRREYDDFQERGNIDTCTN
jgi:hypothetical protein